VRRARTLRRVVVVALFAFLLLAALNVFGVRTSEVTATDGGYELTVRYASVTRPGLASPWSLEIRHEGGFDGPVTVATTASYFELFDENGLDPDPSSAVSDGEHIIWEFEEPPGDVLVVSFDARIEPAAQLTWIHATTSVLEDGAPVVSATYRTFVMP